MSSDWRRAQPRPSLQEICHQGNKRIAQIGRTDIRWVIRNGEAILDWINPPGKTDYLRGETPIWRNR
jgi:hypothetical protein